MLWLKKINEEKDGFDVSKKPAGFDVSKKPGF
jgi:hypothetical protein